MPGLVLNPQRSPADGCCFWETLLAAQVLLWCLKWAASWLDSLSKENTEEGRAASHVHKYVAALRMRLCVHCRYLGNDLLPWNATAELLRAYYVHFSDNPLPKPWLLRPEELASNGTGPSCPPHCEERSVWTSLYQSYHRQMMYC